MSFYSAWNINDEAMSISFYHSIKVDTLVNANFVLTNDDATPAAVVPAFKPIDYKKDFDSINRTLKLWWNTTLFANTDYTLHVSNVKSAITGDLISGTIKFTPKYDINPGVDNSRPTRDPVDVEDYTILQPSPLESGYTEDPDEDDEDDDDDTPTESIKIVKVTPSALDAVQLSEEEYEGRITVEFNHVPASNFVDSDNFRLQKKLIGGGLNKWVNVNTVVAMESNAPVVSIYLPSTDNPAVYSYQTDAPATYWEPAYKYRLTIDKNVGY